MTPILKTRGVRQTDGRAEIHVHRQSRCRPASWSSAGRAESRPSSRQPVWKEDCHITLTNSIGHACAMAREFGQLHGANGIVFACGGDGTVHEAANGLYGTGSALGVLPLGTGNDFARHILPSLKPAELLPLLPKPDIRPIDLVQINDELCINITSFGARRQDPAGCRVAAAPFSHPQRQAALQPVHHYRTPGRTGLRPGI